MKLLEDSSLLGGDRWPPGFRFHPTDEELVLYYLKRKIYRRRLKLDVIGEMDVYKWDPEELPGLSQLKTGDRQWFFFSPRDRKYPNGARSNRATRCGYWKATGKDRTIVCNSRSVGIKKTLVFYKGRAPSGERTDWVMHEYTLDEEELKRCPTALHYYALSKVFKKSGPGPKNGEQYGAPFREEDWADDEEAIVDVNTDQETPLKQVNGFASVDNTGTSGQVYSFQEGNVQVRSTVFLACGQDNNVQASCNPTQSAISHFQLNDTCEVTSAPNMNRQGSHDSEFGFLKDFLEMDDLIGPDFTVQNIEKPVENLSFDDFDGLPDVAMFLNDMGPVDPQPVSHMYFNNEENEMGTPVPSLCPNNLEIGVVNPISCPCFNNSQTEVVQTISQPYHNTLDNNLVNLFNFQLPHHSDVANQLGMHSQNFDITTPVESDQGAIILPTSGVVYTGENQNQFRNQNHNQSGKEDNGGDSWFCFALWAFESIPRTPASASESTVVMNKAFGRLSSCFGRIGDKVNGSAVHRNSNVGNPTATRRRSGNRYNRGFFLFAVLVFFARCPGFSSNSVQKYFFTILVVKMMFALLFSSTMSCCMSVINCFKVLAVEIDFAF